MTSLGGHDRLAGRHGLIGRHRELAELAGLAGRYRLVTLCGAGGSGKTGLLRALTAELAAGFADGAVVIPLGDLRQPELVPSRVAQELGICEEPGLALTATLAAALAGRRLLLALDGAEHVAGACAALFGPLLAGLPDLRVIAASRVPLGAGAEHVWPVPPLTLPGSDPAGAGPAGAAVSAGDAVRFLAARAARTAQGFLLDDDTAPAVARICRALGGVPLALELAAPCLAADGAAAACEAVVARARADGTDPARVALWWAHDRLSPDGQVLLRLLAVFAGWSGETAERVCADAGLAARVARLLSALADAALIRPDPDAGPDRHRMPGAVRDFAAERLAEAGETAMMRRRLRDYVGQLADYRASIGTAQVPATWMVLPEVYRSYEADAANFRGVLSRCREHDDAETGLHICTALRVCWVPGDARAERIWWLDALGQAGGAAVPATVLGPAMAVRAQLAYEDSDLAGAQAAGLAAVELCRAAGETRFSAAGLDVLARVAVRAGRPQDALGYSAEAVELASATGDQWIRAFPLGSRSIALAALGRLTEAVDAAGAGLAIMEELDNQWGATAFRLGLGNLARALGDLDGARGYYLAALPFVRRAMGAPKVARCLAYLGRVELRQGDRAAAREYLAESLRLSQSCGSRAGIIRGLRGLAALDRSGGAPGRAVRLGAAAAALAASAGLAPPPEPRQYYLDAAAGLGPGEAAVAWDAGLRLSTREAVALALEPGVTAPAGTGPAGLAA